MDKIRIYEKPRPVRSRSLYQKKSWKKGDNDQILKSVEIVNVLAIKRGRNANRYILTVSIQVSDPNNATSDSLPARTITPVAWQVDFVGLSEEEQGPLLAEGISGHARKRLGHYRLS
jgi:hypothetical protein